MGANTCASGCAGVTCEKACGAQTVVLICVYVHSMSCTRNKGQNESANTSREGLAHLSRREESKSLSPTVVGRWIYEARRCQVTRGLREKVLGCLEFGLGFML